MLCLDGDSVPPGVFEVRSLSYPQECVIIEDDAHRVEIPLDEFCHHHLAIFLTGQRLDTEGTCCMHATENGVWITAYNWPTLGDHRHSVTIGPKDFIAMVSYIVTNTDLRQPQFDLTLAVTSP